MSEEEAKRYFEFLQTIPTPIAAPPQSMDYTNGYEAGSIDGWNDCVSVLSSIRKTINQEPNDDCASTQEDRKR